MDDMREGRLALVTVLVALRPGTAVTSQPGKEQCPWSLDFSVETSILRAFHPRPLIPFPVLLQVHPQLLTPPQLCVLFSFFQSPINSSFVLLLYPGVGCSLELCQPPRSCSLKENWLPPSHALSVVPQIGVEAQEPLPTACWDGEVPDLVEEHSGWVHEYRGSLLACSGALGARSAQPRALLPLLWRLWNRFHLWLSSPRTLVLYVLTSCVFLFFTYLL